MKQNKFGAAGPHYGHMVQETLMLKYLLEANDDQLISLEYFDDVGIENSKGDRVAVQAKSGLSWNPVADSAIDLWKTIANWISMIDDGKLDPNKTQFVIAIAKERKGHLSSKMKRVSSEEDFETLYKEIQTKFKKTPPKTIAKHIDIFLNTDPEILQKILFNFDIELYSDPKEKILEQLRKQEEEKDIHDIYHMMSGWIKNKLEELIRAGKIPYIAATTFRKTTLCMQTLTQPKIDAS